MGEAAVSLDLPTRLPRPETTIRRLPDGLTVCLLANRRAPVVTTALWYRAGTRDESAGHGGTAHFLEHMMFKGSAAYGPGEIDRRTQSLGGDNNAFTSHDATAYYFNFAPEYWHFGLAVEADRMAGLRLDPQEVEGERRVILEEIAMYEAEPWDALDQRVHAACFPHHAYGRPVLGTVAELKATGASELAAFHRRLYRPSNAVLVVAGDVSEEALDEVAAAFAGVADRASNGAPAAPPAAAGRGSGAARRRGTVRVEQRRGEVARLLVALPAPPASHPDHAALRLASVLLGSGRASRLYRRLVDEENLCAWVTADLSETVEAGAFTVAAELVPGAEPAAVEAVVLSELEALGGARPPTPEEMERAHRVALADWVFAHDRVHQQALAVGFALALFGDAEFAIEQVEGLLAADAEAVVRMAGRYLDGAAAVVGWSLPRRGRR
jgi:zinc protease